MNKSLHMDPHASRLVGPVTAIWKRGHNIACVSQRLQKAVDKVEVWGGGGFQNRGEVLFVLVLSNINIVWQKSLSAPLRTIHTACFENIYI